MKAFRDIRVIPVVMVAIAGFAVLKIAGLVIDGGYVFDYDPHATKPSWAQDQLNFPSGRRDFNDITGSVDEKKKEEGKKDEAKKGEKPKRCDPTARCCIRSRARRYRIPNARCWSGCRRGARSWKHAPARSIFAKACSRPPRRRLNPRSRN
jgi:hypothetical protein